MKKFILLACCLLFPLTVSAATVGQIAAIVNGDMISTYDVHQAALPEMKKNNLNPKKAADQAKIQQLYNATLNNMILEILIIDEAKKQKVTATESEVDAEITRIMQQGRLSKENFEKQLAKEGITVNLLRTKIYNTIMRQKLMGMMVGRKIVLKPEDVKAYYEAHKGEFQNNKENVFALLVYPDTSDVNKYMAQIKKDTRQFEAIAREISIGPNRENGGVIGNIPFDKLDPKLTSLLKKLKQGDTTPVIMLNGKRSQFKLVQAASKGGQMTFEEAKPLVENILREPLLKERFEEYIGNLRKKAMIDIRLNK